MNIPTYVLFIVAPLNIFFNYLFVWGPDFIRLGFVGGAVATSLSYTITVSDTLFSGIATAGQDRVRMAQGRPHATSISISNC